MIATIKLLRNEISLFRRQTVATGDALRAHCIIAFDENNIECHSLHLRRGVRRDYCNLGMEILDAFNENVMICFYVKLDIGQFEYILLIL